MHEVTKDPSTRLCSKGNRDETPSRPKTDIRGIKNYDICQVGVQRLTSRGLKRKSEFVHSWLKTGQRAKNYHLGNFREDMTYTLQG